MRLFKEKILLILSLTTFTNVSFASFPVIDNFIIINDSILSEPTTKKTSEEDHFMIEKQGFDIENCKCESCRNGVTVNSFNYSDSKSSNRSFKIAAILFALSLIVFSIWMIDGISCINDRSTCSDNSSNLMFYLSLITISGYSSIAYLVKGLKARKKQEK